MTEQKKTASHAAIWDDSMLVNSWNDALEEYKQYHSIQARGEKVEDVLKEHENKSNGAIAKENEHEDGMNGIEMIHDEDSHAKQGLANETDDPSKARQVETDPQANTARTQSTGPAIIPQHLIGQVHDENLKNLLMSWYYAGYYTGLYEGQQQGAPSSKSA